jgi:hypothetical protein
MEARKIIAKSSRDVRGGILRNAGALEQTGHCLTAWGLEAFLFCFLWWGRRHQRRAQTRRVTGVIQEVIRGTYHLHVACSFPEVPLHRQIRIVLVWLTGRRGPASQAAMGGLYVVE